MNKQEMEKAIEQLDMQIKCTVNTTSIKTCRLAIESLEKQIPKKPREVVDEKGWEDWACPKCRALIEGGSVMLHCWNCGQKLDWSAEE